MPANNRVEVPEPLKAAMAANSGEMGHEDMLATLGGDRKEAWRIAQDLLRSKQMTRVVKTQPDGPPFLAYRLVIGGGA